MKIPMKMDLLTEKWNMNKRLKELNLNYEVDIEDIAKTIRDIPTQAAHICKIPATPMMAPIIIAHGKITEVNQTRAYFEFDYEPEENDIMPSILKISDVAIFNFKGNCTFESGGLDSREIVLKDPLFIPSIYRFIGNVSDEAKTALIQP